MLPGLRIASPDERDYWAELTSLASRQYVRPYLTYGTTGPCRKKPYPTNGTTRQIQTRNYDFTDPTGPAWIPGCRTVAIRQ